MTAVSVTIDEDVLKTINEWTAVQNGVEENATA